VTCSDAADAAHTFTYLPGTLTVTKKVLTVTASSPTVPHGVGVPAITPSYSAFAGSDDASVLDVAPTCSTAASATSDAGTYPSSCSGGSDGDYAFSFVDGTVTVTAAVGTPVTVTAPSPAIVYGDAIPLLVATYSGGVSPTTPATCTTTASGTPHVGTYDVTCSGAVKAGDTFSYIGGTLTVTKAALTVTASSGSMTQGGTPPTLSPIYAGFENGDTAGDLDVAPSCSTTASSGSAPGHLPSSCSGGSDGDYTFTYVAGDVTVQAPSQGGGGGTGGGTDGGTGGTGGAPTAPAAPSSFSVTVGDGTVTVTVTAPPSDGGSAITSYTVTSSPEGKTCTVTPPATSCTITGLTNGTNYTFTVTTTNAIGTSASSAPSAPVAPTGDSGTGAGGVGTGGTGGTGGDGGGTKGDHKAPTLHLTGARNGATYSWEHRRRHLKCVAHDGGSGVASCRIHTHRVVHRLYVVVHYVVTAKDEAGNVARLRGHYRFHRR
jgi:hypothetical protein